MRLSKSKIQTWLACKKQYKYRYIENFEIFKTSYAAERGILIHKYLENIYDDKEKVFKDLEIRFPEIVTPIKELLKKVPNKPYKSEMNIYDEELNIIGIIDRIEKEGNNTIIIDYKTGKEKDNLDYFRFELSLYTYLYEKETKDIVTHWGIHFVDTNKTIIEKVNRKSIEYMKKKVLKVREDISNEIMFDRTISPLCDYCDYKEHCFSKNQVGDGNS